METIVLAHHVYHQCRDRGVHPKQDGESWLSINSPSFLSQAWEALPPSVQGQLGNNPKEFDKVIGQFSIRNQLRWNNLQKYDLIKCSGTAVTL